MIIVLDDNNVNIPFPQVVVNEPVEFAKATAADKKIANEFVEVQKEAASGLEDVNGKDL